MTYILLGTLCSSDCFVFYALFFYLSNKIDFVSETFCQTGRNILHVFAQFYVHISDRDASNFILFS